MIVVNNVEIFPSDSAVHIDLSTGKKYKILLKDYENLPFECKPDSRLENITIDVDKINLNETNQYFDGDCVAFLIFLARKYNIYRSAISKIAMTDVPKKQLYQKLYFAVYQNYKSQKDTNKYKNNKRVGDGALDVPQSRAGEIDPDILKSLCALVCDEFETAGYINDRRYALDKAKYLKESKKYGAGKIKEYLYQKGIPSDVINETLEDEFFEDEDGDLENMRGLLKKKYGENLNRLDKSDRNAIQKAIHMLVRNGYKYQEAKNAVFDMIEDKNIDFRYAAENEDEEYDEE
jgi:SOS response regulatory protein OraA/RecX